MVKPKSEIQNPTLPEYQCRVNLNIYDSPSCTIRATQAAVSRHLRLLSPTAVDNAYSVCLCEDAYRGLEAGAMGLGSIGSRNTAMTLVGHIIRSCALAAEWFAASIHQLNRSQESGVRSQELISGGFSVNSRKLGNK